MGIPMIRDPATRKLIAALAFGRFRGVWSRLNSASTTYLPPNDTMSKVSVAEIMIRWIDTPHRCRCACASICKLGLPTGSLRPGARGGRAIQAAALVYTVVSPAKDECC